MTLDQIQAKDVITFRNGITFLVFEATRFLTYNLDMTNKSKKKFDIVKIERDGQIIFEDLEYKGLHS